MNIITELTGEDPADILGADWKNTIDEYSDENPLGGSLEAYDIARDNELTNVCEK